MSEIYVHFADGQCSDEGAENMSEILFNFQGIALTMQPKIVSKFVFNLLKVSAPLKQPRKYLKFVFNLLKVIAPMMEPKKCPDLRSVLWRSSRKNVRNLYLTC